MTMTQRKISSFFGKKAAPVAEQGPKRERQEGGDEADDAPTKKPKEQGEGHDAAAKTAEEETVKPTSVEASLPPALAGSIIANSVLEINNGWRDILLAEAKKAYFSNLMGYLGREEAAKKTIFPPKHLVLNAFKLCPWPDVKVVILGQDPYHGPNQAHGLAFSVMPPQAPPPSLVNMIKEAMSDVGITKPSHGSLEKWARQGVLLLNTVLTVRRGEANSHKGQGWEQFTDAVVRELDAQKTGLVFVLWGKPAQEKAKGINKKKHRVLACAHPSPLSATKTSTPFIGSKSFSKVNAALQELGKEPIDWSL